MASSIVHPIVEQGTWTPKLYDADTYIKDLAPQPYYKIGNLVFSQVVANIGNSVTFSAMLQIRNLPAPKVLMGTFSGIDPLTWEDVADHYLQGNVYNGRIYIRPNLTGTYSGYINLAFIATMDG